MQEDVLPVNISLVPHDSGRQEFHYISGKQSEALIVTGPYWTQVFADEDAESVVFELEQTKLRSVLFRQSMGRLSYESLIMGGRSSYEVKGKFSCEGDTLDIEEEYTDKCNRRTITTCYGSVVNKALKDLASRGKLFARRCPIREADSSQKLSSDNTTGPDKYTDLLILKELLDAGAITQQEFDREKAKVLNR
jgi:hypothetical protein